MNADAPASPPTASHLVVQALAGLGGWRIALIAPAGAISDARIEAITQLLKAAGITALPGRHIHEHHRYLAGTRQQRLVDLHEAFEAPDIDAVWCLRGGYGSAQLIDGIQWDRIQADRPLIGHSDITALACAFAAHHKTAVHAPVAADLIRDWPDDRQTGFAASVRSLVAVLGRGQTQQTPRHIAGPRCEGPLQLWGGNLTVLASIADLDLQPRGDQPLALLLEDVGEAAFRLERCLHQVTRTRLFERVAAVVLGDFHNCAVGDDPALMIDIIGDHVDLTRVALFTNAAIGHGADNHAWKYGQIVKVSGSADGSGSFSS
tara:strand:- start:7104 stop:8060 length:957 start_codon:yes stop_codon:yes gene_type:complete